jgi:hypothetical protein
MRDAHSEPLSISQQLHNIADSEAITETQKRLLVNRAYEIEYNNRHATLICASIVDNHMEGF